MKIALVTCLNFGIARNGIRPEPYIPLGLLTVASLAEFFDHTVAIIDINRLPKEKGIRYKEGFLTDAADFVKSIRPDVVGFTSMCYSFPQTIRIAEAVSSDCLVILGGPQATAVDTEVIKEFPFITAVVRGEVEPSLAGFLEWVEGKRELAQVGGITYRSKGQVVRNPDNPLVMDLDTLPKPAYHLYPIKEFPRIPIEAGRGCPFDCTFCSTNLYFNRRYRIKSARRLIQEMQALMNETGHTFFELVHDMFTVDRRKVIEFCEEMLRSDLPLRWRCSARVDRVDRDLLALMRRAGCREMFFGIESGSADVQKSMQKNLKVDEIVPMLTYAQSMGIAPTASFIVGFPDETHQDLHDTTRMVLDLIKRGVKDVQLHMLVPLPGSPLTKTYEEQLVFDKALTKAPGAMWQKSDWDLVERFPKMFSSFYSFPLKYLTLEELRLSYLRMSLTTKILPRLTGIKQGTLNFMRRLFLRQPTTSRIV